MGVSPRSFTMMPPRHRKRESEAPFPRLSSHSATAAAEGAPSSAGSSDPSLNLWRILCPVWRSPLSALEAPSDDLAGHVGGFYLYEHVQRRRRRGGQDEVHVVAGPKSRRLPFSEAPARPDKEVGCRRLRNLARKLRKDRSWWVLCECGGASAAPRTFLITSPRNPCRWASRST